MREQGIEPLRLSRGSFQQMYWPTPTDEEVEAMLEDRRVEKYLQ